MAADDDEVHVLTRRHIDDRLAGAPFPDQEADAHAARPATTHEALRGELPTGSQLIDAIACTALTPGGRRVDDAQDQEIRAEIVGEVEGLDRGAVGDGREVRREEDAPNPTDGTRAGCDSSLHERFDTHDLIVGEGSIRGK